MMNGYEKTHNDGLVTCFSAPNYCYRNFLWKLRRKKNIFKIFKFYLK